MRIVFALAAMAGLAACDGSSSGGVTVDDLDFDEIQDLADALGDEFDDDFINLNYTDPTTLPTGTGASYSGLLSFGNRNGTGVFINNSNADVIGEMQLDVNFAADEITGTADNFYTIFNGAADEALSGELDIELEIDRTADVDVDFSIFGTAEGDLTDPDGITGTADFFVLADFYRDDAEALFGVLNGTVLFSNGGAWTDVGGIVVAAED